MVRGPAVQGSTQAYPQSPRWASPVALAFACLLALGGMTTFSAPANAQSQGASAKARSSADRVMTRNELRACLKESDALKTDKAAVDNERNEVARERVVVLKERDDADASFEAARASLRAERESIDIKNDEAVNAYNQKAVAAQKSYDERRQAVDAKIEAWNKRSQSVTEREKAYNEAQQLWKDGCGSRRYREDDEKAIRAGK